LLSVHETAIRVQSGTIVPRYLTARDEPWIRVVIDEYDGFVGRTALELDGALASRGPSLAAEHGVPPKVLLGVRRVLDSFWRRRIAAAKPPSEVRRVLFEASAELDRFDRDTAIARAAAALGIDGIDIERSMFADLASARRIIAPEEKPSPQRVAEVYNLRAVQSVLLRAETARFEVREYVRSVIRYAKLLRLIATYELGTVTRVTLSGPLTVLRHTTKYGRAFASFLPSVLATPGWRLEADCRLRERRATFIATSADPLDRTFALPRDADSAVERRLIRDVRRLATEWRLERESEAIALSGGRVFFPDFTFRRGDERVLVEVVGYYTPEYLAAKLRAVAAVRSAPVVLAVDRSLACDEVRAVSPEVVFYRRRVDAKELIRAIERVAARWRPP
jgi:predicted nuclease of restriction endonuclease-like RecB superfamily